MNNMFPRFEPFPSPEIKKQLDESYNRNKRAQEATIAQAEIQKNIEENLQVIIGNQKQMIQTLNDRIENTNNILEKLKCLSENSFASQEDAVIVSKEIYKLMLDNNKSGLKEYFADKGGDIAIQGLFVLIQTILSGGIPM